MSKNNLVRILIAVAFLLSIALSGSSYAQKSAANAAKTSPELARIGSAAVLHSDVLALSAVDAAKLKGKVVLVYYWTTQCAVCLEKMHELRSNVAGWKGRPFIVIAINRDEKRQSFEDYVAVYRQLNAISPQFILIHAKDLTTDNLFRAGQLPLSFIVDTSGIVQHMHVGRIPPEAWDQIAELLP